MRPFLADTKEQNESARQTLQESSFSFALASELSRISPHLIPIALPQHKNLLDGKATEAYFLEDGIASVVVTLEEGDTVEVGVIGNDGVVGIPGLLGVENGTSRTFMQIQGAGYSIETRILREEFERPGELRQYLQKYIRYR